VHVCVFVSMVMYDWEVERQVGDIMFVCYTWISAVFAFTDVLLSGTDTSTHGSSIYGPGICRVLGAISTRL